MLQLQSKTGILKEPQIQDYLNSFHALALPLQKYSLSNAWNNLQARKKLIKFFNQGLFKNDPLISESVLTIIRKYAESESGDDRTIKCLRKFLSQGNNQSRTENCYHNDEKERVTRRALQLSSLLRDKPGTFLDIGCGNGEVLKTLTRLWKLPKSNSIGTDVYDRTSIDKNFTYLPIEKKCLPLKNDSVDAAGLLMTLHHEESPERLIHEAARVIKKGGHLIIRDHDSSSIADNLFFEAMDTIYFSVINQNNEVPLSGKYRSGKYWERVAHLAGFSTVKMFNPEPDNPMKPFHLLLVKD